MLDLSKYDFFMDEISSLERFIGLLIQKFESILESNADLQERIGILERENTLLKSKINDLELQLAKPSMDDLFENNTLTVEERKEIKDKLGDLISKLDHHLRS